MTRSFNKSAWHFRKRLTEESGLTLIEMLASMMVFMIVSAGVAGTLTAGLKANVLTQLQTVGKSRAQEQIEEMRSRVFFVPYSADPDVGSAADIDLLDRYFIDLSTSETTDAQGWRGWYTQSGGDAYYTKESPAGENGIVVTVVTRFIDNQGNVVVPAESYDTNTAGSDTPPSHLVEVSVTSSWLDRSEANSYVLVSRISATGQAVQGTADAAEQGCNSSSRSYVDAIGGSFTIYTGSADDYTEIVSGVFGEGYASVETGCENLVTARGTAGSYAIGELAGNGAEAIATGPPSAEVNEGPLNVGPLSGWPTVTITGAYAEGDVEATDMQSAIEAEGGSKLSGGLTASITQVDGWPGGDADGYRRWDFINPVVQRTGSGSDDESWAELQQEGLQAEGVGRVNLPQINIVPLEAKTSNTPSALQGLVFIRDFTAEVHSQAGDGGAANAVTYSATIGMFNPSKSGSCTGDGCYDIYTEIGPDNPVQDVIDLSSSDYRLQNAIFTDFHSFTLDEIVAATYASEDGASATVSIDALLKISAGFGTEIRWKTSNPHKNQITLISPQGYGDFWLGGYDLSFNGAS